MAVCLGLLLVGSTIQLIRISHWAVPAGLIVVSAVFRWLVAFELVSKHWDEDVLAACTLGAILCGLFLAISPGWMRRVAVWGFAALGTVAYVSAIVMSDVPAMTGLFGLPILGSGALALKSLRRSWGSPRRFPLGKCARCGYDISNLPRVGGVLTCPECGWVE